MSESKKCLTESVSALVDEEVSELELHRILKELDAVQPSGDPLLDDSAVGKWCRYNLASQAMGDAPLGPRDISAAVSQSIASEETYSVGRATAGLKLFSFESMGRFAVAASVAMVAILGVQQINTVDSVQDSSFHISEMGIEEVNQAKGPATQFPADFQPMVQARTVAGSQISQNPVVLVNKASIDRELIGDPKLRAYLSEVLEIHSANESENGIQGMLPFARHLEIGGEIGAE